MLRRVSHPSSTAKSCATRRAARCAARLQLLLAAPPPPTVSHANCPPHASPPPRGSSAGALPGATHCPRERDRAEGRTRLRPIDLRLRPAAVQRSLLRVRRQRLQLRQGFAKVLGRLREFDSAVDPRGDLAGLPRTLPARHQPDAARCAASVPTSPPPHLLTSPPPHSPRRHVATSPPPHLPTSPPPAPSHPCACQVPAFRRRTTGSPTPSTSARMRASSSVSSPSSATEIVRAAPATSVTPVTSRRSYVTPPA